MYLIMDVTSDLSTSTVYNHYPMYRGINPQEPRDEFMAQGKAWRKIRTLKANTPANDYPIDIVLAFRI
jgi:hypothetical protein